jgi:hypothetical protein
MPQKDGTGPQGKGPKTGRGMGNCAPKDVSKNASSDTQKNAQPARATRRCGRRGNNNS